MKFLSTILIVTSVAFVGCASSGNSSNNASWREKYQPANNVSGILPYGGKTVCVQFYDRNFERDMKSNVSSGYESLGISIVGSWRNDLGVGQSVEELRLFGESIGADLVTYGLVSQEHEPRVNGLLRMWSANYWRKSKPDPYSVQARFRDLVESESRLVGTRGGAVVLLVVKGGPAYLSDIFEGDVVIELNGVKIQDARDLRSKCKSMGGSEFTLSMLRDGVPLKKVVRLYPQLK
jgi:membrane-associated protease RseP (regulator of RpoE activity)